MADLIQSPLRLDLQDGDEIGRVDQGLIFRAPAEFQIPIVCLFTQGFNPRLHWRINPEVNDTARGFCTSRQRLSGSRRLSSPRAAFMHLS